MLLVLLLSMAIAQLPESAGRANVTIKISGYTPRPQSLYIPQNDGRQLVDYGKLPVKHDSYGNALLTVEGNYSFIFDVSIDASKPKIPRDERFPVAIAGPPEYLGGGAYYDPSDPSIAQRALDVTRNSHTALEAIRDLALWVNSYIEYNTSYWDKIEPASAVLKSRQGVCDEFTNVYIALARSLNIPTRLATGLVYTGTQWQRHAWAESLIGGEWIPVDPTFSEIGLVNAMHIKLYAAPTYLFYQFPQSLEDIKVLGYSAGGYAIPLSVSASTSHSRVPPKGSFFLNVNVTNTGPNVLIPTYAAQKTVGIELLSDFRKSAIIGPGETKMIQWKFVAPYGERDTYYVFLVGPRASKRFPVTVDPMLSAKGYSEFEIKNVYASVMGSKIRIEVGVKNIGSTDYAGVAASVITDMGTQQQTFPLASGSSKVLEFLFPAKAGPHNYEISVSTGNSTANAFGEITVPSKGSGESGEEAVSNFLISNSGWIFVAVMAIAAIGIVMVLLVPIQENKKIPFEEREEWAKLMKLRKG